MNHTFLCHKVLEVERLEVGHILNLGAGHLCLGESQHTLGRNGEVIVAMVDDSATVKTFYKENGHIRLQPENDTMDPIIVPDCQIIGKVFGVFRFF